jgi:hypothetical protein
MAQEEESSELFPICKDKKWGYIDRTGKVVIEPQFDFADRFSEGLAAIRIGNEYVGKHGYIDKTGKVVIEPDFARASRFTEGLAAVQTGDFRTGLRGYINKKGEMVITPQFRVASVFCEGVARVKKELGLGEFSYIDKAGKLITEPNYRWPGDFHDGLARVAVPVGGEGEKPDFRNLRWGYADKSGKMVIEAKFSGAFDFSEELAAVEIDGKWGFIDKTGKIVIKPQFDFVLGGFSEGMACVNIGGIFHKDAPMPIFVGGRWGFINKAGEMVIKPQYDQPQFDGEARFYHGLAAVTKFSVMYYIDKTGKVIWQSAEAKKEEGKKDEGKKKEEPKGELFRICKGEDDEDEDGEKWGYIDETGKVVVEPQFYEAEDFSEGLALVQIYRRDDPRSLMGSAFIDRTGNIVMPSQPERIPISGFSEGLAVAYALGKGDAYINKEGEAIRVKEDFSFGKGCGYIDRKGDYVIKPQFEAAHEFSEGLAAVRIKDKWGYIDKTGKIVAEAQFDEPIIPFSEGLALVKIENKYGYIDKKGEFAIKPQFAYAHSFSDGLAMVEVGHLYGYIDKTGKTVIEPDFDSADSFFEGLASVEIEGKRGYIDKTGRIVIKLGFKYACSFSEGLAAVIVDRLWGFIDKAGKMVINPAFTNAGSFKHGLAEVRHGEETAYIDKTGRYVWREAATPIDTLETIHSVQKIYFMDNGKYGSLGELADADMIDKELGSGKRAGYLFRIKTTFNAWSAVAWPVEPGESASESFFIDDTGVVRSRRYNKAGGPLADENSPPVK